MLTRFNRPRNEDLEEILGHMQKLAMYLQKSPSEKPIVKNWELWGLALDIALVQEPSVSITYKLEGKFHKMGKTTTRWDFKAYKPIKV
jgi:hypothetical protein